MATDHDLSITNSPWRMLYAVSVVVGLIVGCAFVQADFSMAATTLVTTAASDETLDQHVLQLFHEKKCVECHGSAVAKPKEFGYIDNLTLLRDDPNLVVPGDPDASELVFQVEAGLMPPEKSDVTPFDEQQIALLRHWVEALPPTETFVVQNEKDVPIVEENVPMQTMSLGDRWLRFLGQFHPATVHFPIAFLIGALLAEFWRVTSGRESVATATRFCLWMGALSAAPTAVLGWLNAGYGGYDDWAHFPRSELDIHRCLGVATAVGAWLVLMLYEFRLRYSSARLRTYFNWALLVLAVLTAATGFFGGLVSYGGLSHYAF